MSNCIEWVQLYGGAGGAEWTFECTEQATSSVETVVVQLDALSTLFGQGFVAGASVLLLAIPIRLILKAVRN